MGRLKAFDETRALDAAVDCFWSRGYEATSIRDLADAMRIGGASLYNAYGDKRALFARSLQRYAERSMRERIARLEANHRPKEAIRAFLAEIIDRSLTTSTHAPLLKQILYSLVGVCGGLLVYRWGCVHGFNWGGLVSSASGPIQTPR